MSPTIRTEVSDGIAVVTIDAPPVNALTGESFRELVETFRSIDAGSEANVAVLAAAGERAFCAGVDLQDAARRQAPGHGATPRDVIDPGLAARTAFEAVLDCAVPVIAVVDGATVGAGVALVASCDIILASPRARFALTEINAGVLGGGRHLQRLVGTFKTRRMMYTGAFQPAEELYRLGAIEALHPSDELMPAALEMAGAIAAKSPMGVRLAKESLNRVEFAPLKEGYRTEQDYTTRIKRYADSREAAQAYIEKRAPQWTWT